MTWAFLYIKIISNLEKLDSMDSPPSGRLEELTLKCYITLQSGLPNLLFKDNEKWTYT